MLANLHLKLTRRNYDEAIRFYLDFMKLLLDLLSINHDVFNSHVTSSPVEISLAIKLCPNRTVIGNETVPTPAIGYMGVSQATPYHP